MRLELKEALKAVQNLADGAARRRRGLDQRSVQSQAFTCEIEAYARVIDALTQMGERNAAESLPLGARTLVTLGCNC